MSFADSFDLLWPDKAEFIIALIFFVLCLAAYFVVLIDILKSEFTNNNKLIWLLVVVFLHIIGIILYLTVGRKQKIK